MMLTVLTTSAPTKAAPNPLTWKPSCNALDRALVSHSMKPFSTNVNNPSVTRKNGKVSNIKIGLTLALRTPKTRATAKSSHQLPVNDTPGTRRMATH